MEDQPSASESSGDDEALVEPGGRSKGNLRVQARNRLRYLLDKLVKRRNWGDASGVLSVLLKGTCEERSLHNNRIKYSVAMELLQYAESDRAYSKDVEKVHDLWMKKIAPKKNRLWKDEFVVFDSIIFSLVEKNYDRARSLALWYNREADNDPISCLILGLCYYELWYSALPKERQLIDLHEPELFDETEKPKTELYSDVANSKEYQPFSMQDGNSSFKYHSETSIMNDKALLPLVQILLLNDHVKEALDELEKFCNSSKSLFASRLKTHFIECLGCKVKDLLLSWYEDILQKDPTCKHSIIKLVRAYKMGDYDPVRLLEMIALHLEATFADHEIWCEFASCLLKVCQCDEDRVSTCLNGDVGERSYQDKKIPDMFLKGVVGKNWMLRCKWWLNRHFNKKLLESEMAGGELPLMAYKAACASQMYGPGFHYVMKVGTILRDEKDPLFMVLNTYVQGSSSFGFYPELSGGSKGMVISSSWTEVFSCVGTTEEEKTIDEEKEGGEKGGDKNVRRRGRPKAQDKGKSKRGRPKKELVDEQDP